MSFSVNEENKDFSLFYSMQRKLDFPTSRPMLDIFGGKAHFELSYAKPLQREMVRCLTHIRFYPGYEYKTLLVALTKPCRILIYVLFNSKIN